MLVVLFYGFNYVFWGGSMIGRDKVLSQMTLSILSLTKYSTPQ